MNLVVASESRFSRTPDGSYWSKQLESSFFNRYLEVFDKVSIIARIHDVDHLTERWNCMNNQRVEFCGITPYSGPIEYLRSLKIISQQIHGLYDRKSAFLFRAPTPLATSLLASLTKNNHPYGVEVVGDPWDVFSPGAFPHVLRPLMRIIGYLQLRSLCHRAYCSAYVTQHALQKRYPPARDRFSTHYSTIELSDNAFSEKGRYEKYSHARNSACLRIVTVGTLHALYKGPDILIEAIRKCIAKNFDLRATWVGDGRHRIGLIKMAKEAGLSEKVSFIGALPAGAAVREILDQADIYVLPSRQEGLPRSVLEAMARTLPVIATNVGGISELIDAEFIIPPGDSDALASKIMELSSDPWLLQSAATANELTAKDYHVSILQQRRYQFYEYLRAATASASL